MRWLYHLAHRNTLALRTYEPESLQREGFIHCSYAAQVIESARRHFSNPNELVAWRIDPRRVHVPIVEADTPRGKMPHIHGVIAADAVRAEFAPSSWASVTDVIKSHRIAFVFAEGTTLLDFAGIYDPLSRIPIVDPDTSMTLDLIRATEGSAWKTHHATLILDTLRPSLLGYDLVVVPGSAGVHAFAKSELLRSWLTTHLPSRAWATLGSGVLALASAGVLRGRRVTAHTDFMPTLAGYEDISIDQGYVVQDQNLFSASGSSASVDLGMALVRWLTDEDIASRVAAQLDFTPRRS
jgi:cyclohexyl-isocyanide hydratase